MVRLSDEVLEIGRRLVEELEQQSPLYQAVRDGRVSREGYIEFLVQHHKYIRFTYDLMKRYSAAMAASPHKQYRTIIRAGAANHAEEERGHDDGIVQDLARIWGVSFEDAKARIETFETAPSLRLYEATFECALAHFPGAIAGLASVLESVGTALCRSARAAILAERPWLGIEDATQFLKDHEEDGSHLEGGRLRMDLLEPDHDASALRTVSRITSIIYREMYRYLDGRLAGRVVAERQVVHSA